MPGPFPASPIFKGKALGTRLHFGALNLFTSEKRLKVIRRLSTLRTEDTDFVLELWKIKLSEGGKHSVGSLANFSFRVDQKVWCYWKKIIEIWDDSGVTAEVEADEDQTTSEQTTLNR